ncbi:hypothetical protein KC614_03730 [candidate division WWE3 bacterium]|uniref:Uncharacterized protein n=1 Tax=candidate division WWE3 bacterium TaxID=2053526 RepID=A0A955LLW6_UNCKA|nr:hypothetical protein [candidate division WWE3 bacterium]
MADNVYFQPPTNIELSYPCIIYKRDRAATRFADNIPYKDAKGYQITVIDANPDSEIPDKVAVLPMCMFDRFFPADNLNHFVYNIFF